MSAKTVSIYVEGRGVEHTAPSTMKRKIRCRKGICCLSSARESLTDRAIYTYV